MIDRKHLMTALDALHSAKRANERRLHRGITGVPKTRNGKRNPEWDCLQQELKDIAAARLAIASELGLTADEWLDNIERTESDDGQQI